MPQERIEHLKNMGNTKTWAQLKKYAKLLSYNLSMRIVATTMFLINYIRL